VARELLGRGLHGGDRLQATAGMKASRAPHSPSAAGFGCLGMVIGMVVSVLLVAFLVALAVTLFAEGFLW
jgi:uncharacterized membrane protein